MYSQAAIFKAKSCICTLLKMWFSGHSHNNGILGRLWGSSLRPVSSIGLWSQGALARLHPGQSVGWAPPGGSAQTVLNILVLRMVVRKRFPLACIFILVFIDANRMAGPHRNVPISEIAGLQNGNCRLLIGIQSNVIYLLIGVKS